MWPFYFILSVTSQIPGEPVPTESASGNALRVTSQVFDLDYEVNEAALPLTSVRLWYTLNGGATWDFYGEDEDRHPPFGVLAPREGEYGFFLVMENATGASGPTPTPGSRPQVTVFVDYAAPLVQLQTPVQTTALSQRILQIRWTAVDANFPARPIQIDFQCPIGGSWRQISPDPMANTGRFDWRIPADMDGSLALRLTATDRGGSRTESEVLTVELAPRHAAVAAAAVTPLKEPPATPKPVEPVVLTDAGESGRAQAVRLYAEALAYRDRGEYRQAVSRLRDVVRLDPEGVEAMQEMASLLYMSGDYERSLEAYNLVLARQPMSRSAILGAARVHRQRQEYETAAEKLRSLLRYNPNDGEAWMALGDIGVYKGDEILARECYTRAMHAKSGDLAVAEDARQRLTLMSEATRAVP